MPALSVHGAVKRYGEITAVDGLDLEVPEGACVGLLGPNGAGKSTTMKMLTAQARPDEGEIEVLGYDVPTDSKQARAQCGVVPQLDNLDIELTARQNLAVFARLYRVPHAERRAAEVVDLAGVHLERGEHELASRARQLIPRRRPARFTGRSGRARSTRPAGQGRGGNAEDSGEEGDGQEAHLESCVGMSAAPHKPLQPALRHPGE